jgi:pimeloyl-ACP methyl ester carboxylesterase
MATRTQFTRSGLAFNVTEAGPPDGEPVLLLHGFPQHASSWDALVPLLTEAGYRTLGMDQRGYSPGARPVGRRAYRMTELAADAAAAIDALAGGRAHVVGHDLGALVGWALAAAEPARVASLTALSVPHPMGYLHSLPTSTQALRSWYICFFQLPALPERVLHDRMTDVLVHYGQSSANARRDVAGFTAPGALTAALNWYRALPFVDPRDVVKKVAVPSLMIWSDRDPVLGPAGVRRTKRYVSGPYQCVTLHGVSHWIPDEAPEQTADLLLAHLGKYPLNR